jgi:hypothetical protein
MASSTRRRTVEFRLDPIDRCYDPRWFFGGEERTINKYRMLVIFLDDLEKCTATDLQAALRRARKLCGDLYYPLPVVILQDDFYDEVLATPEPIHFKMLDEDLTFSVSFGLDPRDVRDPPQLVGTVLQPLLQRQGMTIVDSGSHEGYPPETLIFVDVSIAFNTRGRTLRELYDLGNDAIALIDAIDSGQLTRKTAGDLIRAGHANVLIGQPERHWLDVKSQHYELSQLAGKIKLAVGEPVLQRRRRWPRSGGNGH